MFLAHYGVALAAKRAAPRASLGVLVLAAQLADLVWPILLLLGVEDVRIAPGITAVTPLDFVHYPWTHSLLMVLAWSLLAAVGYRLATRDARGALVVGALVTSHWFLDLLVHRPDLPLVPGGETRLGLGLWHSVPATLLLEAAFLAVGVALYRSTTRPRSRAGAIVLWTFLAFLVVVYLATAFGAPPPDVRALALVGLSAWLLPLWAWWADRYHAPTPAAAPTLHPTG